MKKNYSFYAILLGIPVLAFLFLGYSSGQTNAYSGSPGDNNFTCAVCHTGTANYGAVASIDSDIPADGYELSHTYSITVSVSSPQTRHGFQITAEKVGGIKVGSFETGGNGNVQVESSHHLVTHTYAGNSQTSWTFLWTSPASDEGEITFYVAANATNADNSDSGDQIVTTSRSYAYTTVGISEYDTLQFNIFPNPSSDFIHTVYDVETTSAIYNIIDLEGKSLVEANYTSNQEINISTLSKGIYFLTIKDGDNKGVMKFLKN